jgi:hypothetical protein
LIADILLNLPEINFRNSAGGLLRDVSSGLAPGTGKSWCVAAQEKKTVQSTVPAWVFKSDIQLGFSVLLLFILLTLGPLALGFGLDY